MTNLPLDFNTLTFRAHATPELTHREGGIHCLGRRPSRNQRLARGKRYTKPTFRSAILLCPLTMRHLSLSLLMTSTSYLCLALAYLQNLAPSNVYISMQTSLKGRSVAPSDRELPGKAPLTSPTRFSQQNTIIGIQEP